MVYLACQEQNFQSKAMHFAIFVYTLLFDKLKVA